MFFNCTEPLFIYGESWFQQMNKLAFNNDGSSENQISMKASFYSFLKVNAEK